MSHKNKSEPVLPTRHGRGARTRSGAHPGNRPGTRRSSGKKPSATNLSRGGGSAATSARGLRGQSKSKSRRESKKNRGTSQRSSVQDRPASVTLRPAGSYFLPRP